MFAIVEIAGLQYKVEQDQKLFVNRLKGEQGDKLSFDKVLLTDNGTITVGAPAVKGIAVEAEILDHVKSDKVIVFKKKRRKGYKVKNGHRQQMTQIKITGITGFDGAKKAEPKKAAKKSTAKKGDDLTKVEGIGPKVAGIFAEAGIGSFADLAAKTPEELKAILTPHGGRYAGMTTDTWPKQAGLAAEGKWDELKKWQDELDGGR